MTPLHTVNKSPFVSSALQHCLDHLTDNAAVLLLEDGVYAVFYPLLEPLAAQHLLYVLRPDLEARGLADRPLIPGMRVIDYGGFVDLAAAHSPIVAWF